MLGFHMADGLEETEKLFARANAAIAEAARLAEESYVRRKSLCEAIRHMQFKARFRPKTDRFYTPADFLFRLGPTDPCSKKVNGNGASGECDIIFDPLADSSD
jgi:hypothetical protein